MKIHHPKVKAILFDLDGTLVDTTAFQRTTALAVGIYQAYEYSLI